jgi:hypothetical protein
MNGQTMNSNGTEIVIEKAPPARDKLLKVIKKFWPGAVIDEPVKNCGVLFIYRNRKARAFWNKEKEERSAAEFHEDELKEDAELIELISSETKYSLVIDKAETLKSIAQAIQKL